ncbi:MAG: GatB/YqeY domain-containing protein [Candidatus ainarchaeum sp.]|nr:GatB/YqeY domain-containing protein [Candidatus ainarchaeum sp.]
MSLHQTIRDQIKESMKAGDKVRLEVMRGLVTAFTNELVAQKRTPQDVLTDEEALLVISRLSKQRKDSIEQFTKGGRMDLVEEETKQLAILSEYLPEMMGKEDIEKIAKNKKDELGLSDPSKKGLLMSSLMKDLKGKADGAMVREVVDQLFI